MTSTNGLSHMQFKAFRSLMKQANTTQLFLMQVEILSECRSRHERYIKEGNNE